MGYQITYMLNKFYRNRLNRIAVQIGLFPLGFLYGGLKGKELDYLSPIIMSCEGLAWLSFILLTRTLFHDRIALGAGAFAGFIWLMFRDAATMPFAAGTAAIFVHFYRNRQAPGQIHAWYLFVWYLAAAICCGYGSNIRALLQKPAGTGPDPRLVSVCLVPCGSHLLRHISPYHAGY